MVLANFRATLGRNSDKCIIALNTLCTIDFFAEIFNIEHIFNITSHIIHVEIPLILVRKISKNSQEFFDI